MPLFLDIISYIGTVRRLIRGRFIIYIQHFACGFVGWMWACSMDALALYWSKFVIGFKSVEELYPSPPLGVDSADTSQLPKEKNLHWQFQYFRITQPGSSTVTTVTPLYGTNQ